MNNIKSLLCVTILFTFLLNSCSSDDSDNSEPQTTLELLTSGKWYFESQFQDTLTPCEKIGYMEFKNDGTFVVNNYWQESEGCQLVNTIMGSYTLMDDETLNIVTENDTFEIYILTISEDEMAIIVDEIYTLDKIEG